MAASPFSAERGCPVLLDAGDFDGPGEDSWRFPIAEDEPGSGPDDAHDELYPDETDLPVLGFGTADAGPTMAPDVSLHMLAEHAVGGLAAMGEDAVIELIAAARRLRSRAEWLEAQATAEFAARRWYDGPAKGPQRRPDGRLEFTGRAAEFAPDEIAFRLTEDQGTAQEDMELALALRGRLAQMGARLAAGEADLHRCRIVGQETSALSDENARLADEILAPDAGGLRYGMLRRRARKIAMMLDPDAGRERRERATRKRARVEIFPEGSGNHAFAGRELPTEEALACDAYVKGMARHLKAHGVPGSLREIEVMVYLDLNQGRDPRAHIPGGHAQDSEAAGSEPASQVTEPGCQDSGAGPADSDGPHRHDGDNGACGEGRDGTPGGARCDAGVHDGGQDERRDPRSSDSQRDDRRSGARGGGQSGGSGQDTARDGSHRSACDSGDIVGQDQHRDPRADDSQGDGRRSRARRGGQGDSDPAAHGGDCVPRVAGDGHGGSRDGSRSGGDDDLVAGAGSGELRERDWRVTADWRDEDWDDCEDDPGASDGDDPNKGGGPWPFSPPGPGKPGGRAPFPAKINLLVPVGSLLGWSAMPGEAGREIIGPATLRNLVQAASHHPATRWCVTLIGTDRTAMAHGCARGHHAWNPEPAGKPGGDPESRRDSEHEGPDSQAADRSREDAASRDGPGRPRDGTGASVPTLAQQAELADLLARLKPDLEPIATEAGDHAHREDSYRPSRKLQDMIRARNATCPAPGCGASSAHCDIDHTTPWPAGDTDEANLGPPCRHHHRAKQGPGWNLQQPQPGLFRWQTPTGHVYYVGPSRYDI